VPVRIYPGNWRPLVFGLAAALVGESPAVAQMSYEEKLQLCSTCHGEDGNSKMEKVPSLAGQPAFYTLNQLFLMREGVRQVEAMAPFVKELTDQDLDRLSKHYAGLPAQRSDEPVDPALARRGAEISNQRRCGSCHLPDLSGQDQMARLAKQRIDYTIPTLKSYRDNPRAGADTAMSAAVAGASDADIAALAHYCASM
jgi:cytochrome c553